MSVRSAILAILELGPCYGNQLRLEYRARTGADVNVGQIYSTLERLERDGLVTRGEVADGQIPYAITPAGSLEAAEWLASPVERPVDGRAEWVEKLSLAATIPGADAASLIAAQRAAALTAAANELAWLDEAERRIVESQPYGLAADTPRRGRPSASATRG